MLCLECREVAEVVDRRSGGSDGGVVKMTVVDMTSGDGGW